MATTTIITMATTATITMATTITITQTSANTSQTIVSITSPADPIVGLYNTSAGQSTGAYNGRYSGPAEEPPKVIDGLLSTKYLNFGFQGSASAILNDPGVNTGFYVTPTISTASVAVALLFATANDFPNRDPLAVTLEGTNATDVGALNLGSSWTLIYSGPTGIDPAIAPARSTYVPPQNFSNTIAFRSYRLLVTSQRGPENSVQYAEAQILGYI
ncbi:unnamed protein product [Rotaria sp. Silwood1]|nr:unnamed protein product [Rotaria sp. Silwood1]CAF3724125.1 unnamed protein product [Rotaria sp. Silwood1]CAF3779331.1 unnamed protein product [Rotaria sp. Silwood1]CAF4688183.1 unnamed protein product [Rotaria sp. Silwood1]CAF4736726.1 unnamed protein product [Rotaria sp. Silwood1]